MCGNRKRCILIGILNILASKVKNPGPRIDRGKIQVFLVWEGILADYIVLCRDGFCTDDKN